MSQALTDLQLLTIWERGLALGPTERALLTLAVTDPDCDLDAVRGWPVGKRDARLLELRAATFGPGLRCCVVCPNCRAELEFDINVLDLCETTAPGDAALTCEIESWRVQARLPTSIDLQVIEQLNDTAAGEALLWERCVEVLDPAGQRVDCDALEPRLRAQIETLLDQADPLLDPGFQVACTACGHEWIAPCNPAHTTWLDIARCARALLAEVDLLARAYGWTEREILGLSRVRRQLYLSQLEH
jgi:hypothetical protein